MVVNKESEYFEAKSLPSFEKAAQIRDRLKRLNILKEEQSVVTLADDIDIFSYANNSSSYTFCGF